MTAADHTVCFTGHRPKSIFPNKPYDEARRRDYQAIVDRIADFVCDMAEKGYTRFVSGGAQGFDQLAFWAVHKAKKTYPHIINDVYIPFDGQEQRWAKTGLFSQKEYNLMLNLADNVTVCTQDIDTSNFKAVTRALMDRNKCMVNDSAYVFGQFEDSSWQDPRTKSGTADCLRYAKSTGRQIGLFDGCRHQTSDQPRNHFAGQQ